jgi:lipid-binding SYLF domain-containing protein
VLLDEGLVLLVGPTLAAVVPLELVEGDLVDEGQDLLEPDPLLDARAEEKEVIDARVNLALGRMWGNMPETRTLSSRASAILVMPEVLKGGLIVGGAYGEGALLMNDEVQGYTAPAAGYYSIAAASLGLQLGIQTTSHVLFFMTADAVQKFRQSDGWEIGADAEVAFPEKGLSAQANSTLHNNPVIGVVFGQDGLMIGASLEGAKYSPISR